MIEGPEFYLEKSENPEFCLENIQFKHFHPNFATIPPIILESKNLQMFQFPRFPENHLSNCLALQDLVRFVHQYLLLPTAPPNGSSTAPSVQSPGSWIQVELLPDSRWSSIWVCWGLRKTKSTLLENQWFVTAFYQFSKSFQKERRPGWQVFTVNLFEALLRIPCDSPDSGGPKPHGCQHLMPFCRAPGVWAPPRGMWDDWSWPWYQ